jgi:hypothetical protein
MLKNSHLLRCPNSSSLRHTANVRLAPQNSGALYLTIFEKPQLETE